MAENNGGAVLRHIRSLVGSCEADGPSDAFLLEQFVSQRDESAFAILLKRHGWMTMGVCSRIFRDQHLAEDAFQATFLVLALKAGAVRKKSSVASWLYGVAVRLSRKLKTESYRFQQPVVCNSSQCSGRLGHGSKQAGRA